MGYKNIQKGWSDDVKRLNPDIDAIVAVKRVAASNPFKETAVPSPKKKRTKKQPSEIEIQMAAILSELSQELDLPPFVAEYNFNPERKHRADFACVELKILVEVEGGGWLKTKGGHGKGHLHPIRFEKDCEKYNAATSLGWQLYRFTGNMIRDGRAEAFLRSVIPPF